MKRTHKPGVFAPSVKWAYYKDLQGVDAGYLTPLYNIGEVRKRYGLTKNGEVYFKKYIMPPPFDIVRRRSTMSHHWSRFTFMALDVVLKDLESLGINYFSRKFTGHIEMVAIGTEYMASYYSDMEERSLSKNYDRFGVQWINDSRN
jgi:hypothetical protein